MLNPKNARGRGTGVERDRVFPAAPLKLLAGNQVGQDKKAVLIDVQLAKLQVNHAGLGVIIIEIKHRKDQVAAFLLAPGNQVLVVSIMEKKRTITM